MSGCEYKRCESIGKIHMVMHPSVKYILGFFLFFFFTVSNAFAQVVSTESQKDCLNLSSSQATLDCLGGWYPPANISCNTRGSFAEIIPDVTNFSAQGNSIFVDTMSREIGIFENAESQDGPKKVSVKIFVNIGNVQRGDVVDLLIHKKLITTKNANIIFIVKENSGTTDEKTYVYDGKDESGNPIYAIIWSRVHGKLKNITYRDRKFVLADATIKFRFPQPPKMVTADGNLVDVFDNATGYLICECKDCPMDDFEMPALQEAFDGGLVDDVINEATSP